MAGNKDNKDLSNLYWDWNLLNHGKKVKLFSEPYKTSLVGRNKSAGPESDMFYNEEFVWTLTVTDCSIKTTPRYWHWTRANSNVKRAALPRPQHERLHNMPQYLPPSQLLNPHQKRASASVGMAWGGINQKFEGDGDGSDGNIVLWHCSHG